jgi:hypothetical protein
VEAVREAMTVKAVQRAAMLEGRRDGQGG